MANQTSYTYVQLAPILSGWPTMLLGAALGMVLAVLLSLVRPLEYSSTTSILITQDLGNTVDPYTASRAAERTAEILGGAVYFSTFFDEVMNSGYNIDEAYFPQEEGKRRKKWENVVSTSVLRTSGVLQITVYHPDVTQAEEIADAVAYVATVSGWRYVPGGSDIAVQIVDDALNSRFPVRPNLPVNAVSGLFLGGIGGAAYVLVQAERLRRRHQFVHTE